MNECIKEGLSKQVKNSEYTWHNLLATDKET